MLNNNTKLTIKVKKLDERAKTPSYGTSGAMAFDIYPIVSSDNIFENHIKPGLTKVLNTGLCMEVPKGYGLFLFSRSGQGFKNHVTLINGTGLIDSDYRGEIKVMLRNDHPSTCYFYNKDVAIAQGVVMPIPLVNFLEVDKLSSTDRGVNGFGSTDKK